MDLLSGNFPQSAINTQIGKSPTLVEEVTTRITSDITRGLLPPGGRLPTEKDMMLSMGVSRTVIREAIAQLRSRGLVFTQQGRGAFVAEDALAGPLHITIAGEDATRDTLHLLDIVTRMAAGERTSATTQPTRTIATAPHVRCTGRADQRLTPSPGTIRLARNVTNGFPATA